MKKFVFSLNSLYELKSVLKDKLQAEYAASEAVLKSAIRKKDDLENTLSEKSEEFESKVKRGMSIGNIQEYVLFFEELQESIKASLLDIENAQRTADLKRAELVESFREIEILRRLREKQRREYLKEEDRKELNILEDIMSFKVTELGTITPEKHEEIR